MIKQFGGKATSDLIKRYSQSPNWKSDKFENMVETVMEFSFPDLPAMIYKQFTETKGRRPQKPLPIQPFDKDGFLADSEAPKFIWYGHSVVLMRWMDKTILIDPMMGPNASPIAPFATKRYSENTLEILDQLPPLDLVLMTHDHYDHLDMASIERIKAKTKQWYVALGVGRHLEAWGVDDDFITEFDWWDAEDFHGLNFTFTPSRHFSGRGLTDKAKSLWGGWAMKSASHNLYWSGDGGYGDHFKEVGDKLGPFDFGFMECGQYNEMWHQIHMYPEEAVKAALDAGVKRALPVHWCGFALALHHWKDPIDRFHAEAMKQKLNISTPELGKITSLDTETKKWWQDFE